MDKIKIDTIIFDLDSTLVTIEGLDWLAKEKKIDHEVRNLTKLSMDGRVNFSKAMAKKMEIISPSRSDIQKMGEAYLKNLVPDVKDTINVLSKKGIDVWVVTGNFEPAVQMVANELGIRKENVRSNIIYYDKFGNYNGFDTKNPLSANYGKAVVIKQIPNYSKRTIAFVGDGVTDLEAKSVVNVFIGFGGVVEREVVKANADIYITDASLKSLQEMFI